jgi:hypothetical protein
VIATVTISVFIIIVDPFSFAPQDEECLSNPERYPHTGNGVTYRNLNAQFIEGANAVFIKPIASTRVVAARRNSALSRNLLKINAQPKEPARGCEISCEDESERGPPSPRVKATARHHLVRQSAWLGSFASCERMVGSGSEPTYWP